MATTLPLGTNISFAATPPDYTLPDAAHFALGAVPAGLTRYDLAVDLANLPSNQHVTPAQEWSFDGGATWRETASATYGGGSYTTHTGGTSTVLHLSGDIPTAASGWPGYPTHARIHVKDLSQAFVAPTASVTLS